MPGLLGTKANPIYDVNLVLQIVIVILLIRGLKLARNRKLKTHGMTMMAAVILHTISVLLIMAPSVVIYFDILLHPSNIGVIVTWAHVVAGILAEALGILIVATWVSKPRSMFACAKRKNFMLPTLTIWMFVLLLGIVFYAFYYL